MRSSSRIVSSVSLLSRRSTLETRGDIKVALHNSTMRSSCSPRKDRFRSIRRSIPRRIPSMALIRPFRPCSPRSKLLRSTSVKASKTAGAISNRKRPLHSSARTAIISHTRRVGHVHSMLSTTSRREWHVALKTKSSRHDRKCSISRQTSQFRHGAATPVTSPQPSFRRGSGAISSPMESMLRGRRQRAARASCSGKDWRLF